MQSQSMTMQLQPTINWIRQKVGNRWNEPFKTASSGQRSSPQDMTIHFRARLSLNVVVPQNVVAKCGASKSGTSKCRVESAAGCGPNLCRFWCGGLSGWIL
jgi:hypothetical protein